LVSEIERSATTPLRVTSAQRPLVGVAHRRIENGLRNQCHGARCIRGPVPRPLWGALRERRGQREAMESRRIRNIARRGESIGPHNPANRRTRRPSGRTGERPATKRRYGGSRTAIGQTAEKIRAPSGVDRGDNRRSRKAEQPRGQSRRGRAPRKREAPHRESETLRGNRSSRASTGLHFKLHNALRGSPEKGEATLRGFLKRRLGGRL